jgi:hypothetical protein
MKDTDKISRERKRRNDALAAEIREAMKPTEEMAKAGQEALFDVAPDWTMQEREDLAVAVFKAMEAARAQPAAEPALQPPFDEATCRATCDICPGNRWDNWPCAKARALATLREESHEHQDR